METPQIKELIEEVQEAAPIAAPESSGLSLGQGVGIIVVVGLLAIAAKKVRCCKKK